MNAASASTSSAGPAVVAAAADHSYLHANAAFDDELGRLHLLQARSDPHTFQRLATFGPLAGTRCLEVGAGAGSVARWLAAQVGPAGQVVATDADPRFLADAQKAGVEVRRHDILADQLEPGHYDLAHCRALLFHLADPRRAVRNMAAAVRRGGWLLIEDADYVSLVAANPAHPRAGRFDQVTQQLSAFFAASGILDPFIGRCLPSFVTAAGLTDTGFEAVACLRQGGSAEADLLRRSLDRLHPLALTNGVAVQQQLDAVSAATADPSFSFLDALSVAAWGRVPDPAHVVQSLVDSQGGSRNRGERRQPAAAPG
jgi:SAM-dependent methyltransferase